MRQKTAIEEFDKIANEIDNEEYTGESEQENAIEFLRGAQTATVTFCQGRYFNKIKQLAKEYPDKVQIKHETDKGLVAHVPVRWIKVSAPRKVSEEQREAARERFQKYHAERQNKEEQGGN